MELVRLELVGGGVAVAGRGRGRDEFDTLPLVCEPHLLAVEVERSAAAAGRALAPVSASAAQRMTALRIVEQWSAPLRRAWLAAAATA